jgi:hypothetical protein
VRLTAFSKTIVPSSGPDFSLSGHGLRAVDQAGMAGENGK